MLDASSTGAEQLLAQSVRRYETVRVLGRGSFGLVLLVRLEQSSACSKDGLLVIKRVGLPDIEGKAYTDALKEIKVLRQLFHPNIIGYHEAFTDGTTLCIVMEYAAGGDLGAMVMRRREACQRFPERQAMAVFAQLTLALHYLHDSKILHRDLKSANVFLTATGMVKLGDFGIATFLGASRVCAETRVGSPYYLPPEICEGKPYDFKADVWCLGVVFYEMLALEVPFAAQNIAVLVVRIVTMEPRPVPTLYSGETRILVARLLAKLADDRPAIDQVAAFPHVRRSIAALAAPCAISEHRVDDTCEFVACAQASTELTSSPLRSLQGAMAPSPGERSAGVWPVDLAEVEDLIRESPQKRPRAFVSRAEHCRTPPPPSYPPPIKKGWSTESFDFAELEQLLDAKKPLERESLSVSPSTKHCAAVTSISIGEKEPNSTLSPFIVKPLAETTIRLSKCCRNLEGDF